MKKSTCRTCKYFFNCETDGNEIREYCFTNPEVLGYCHLWDGPVVNCEPCYGYTVN